MLNVKISCGNQSSFSLKTIRTIEMSSCSNSTHVLQNLLDCISTLQSFNFSLQNYQFSLQSFEYTHVHSATASRLYRSTAQSFKSYSSIWCFCNVTRLYSRHAKFPILLLIIIATNLGHITDFGLADR